MENIFIQSSGLLAIIILGYLMKRLNLLSKKDGDRLSIIIVYLNLKAAIIVNFWHLVIHQNLLRLILLGIV